MILSQQKKKPNFWRSQGKALLYAVLVALLFRTFLYQPFYIPSSSMVPNLLVGDYLFVSKSAYGYSSLSLPFSPYFFTGRIFSSLPERGDVVVFQSNNSGSEKINYIKRIVGIPGDTLQVIKGRLHLNGKPLAFEDVGDYINDSDDEYDIPIPLYQETLPSGVAYNVLDTVGNTKGDNTSVYKVPSGHYFLMGDNRDNSNDSRYNQAVGFVPLDHIIGKATFVFFSVRYNSFWQVWDWSENVRWDRIGKEIQ